MDATRPSRILKRGAYFDPRSVALQLARNVYGRDLLEEPFAHACLQQLRVGSCAPQCYMSIVGFNDVVLTDHWFYLRAISRADRLGMLITGHILALHSLHQM